MSFITRYRLRIVFRSVLALICLGVACNSVRANVLLDDTWADGTRTDQNLPTESAWFASTGTALTTAAGSMTLTLSSSAVLGVTYFTASSNTPVQLDVGDSLTAAFRMTLSGVSANTSQGFRIGIFDFADSSLTNRLTADGFSSSSQGTNVQGYALFQNMSAPFNGSSPIDIRKRTTLDDSLLGTSGDWTSLTTGPGNTNSFPGFSNSIPYTLVLSLQRTAVSSLAISVTWSNGSSGATLATFVTDTGATNFNFDGIAWRPQNAASSATTITFQELKVELNGGSLPPPSAPAITNQPQNQVVSIGQNATFTLGASGTAPLSYQWYFNTNTTISGGTNASLTVTNAQLTNAGMYSVVVTNSAGSTNSTFVSLTVNGAPSITAQPQSQTAAIGQSASFSVVAGGSAPLSYQWYFNATDSVPGATNATLTLSNVQTNNAGNYHVIVTNSSGAATSAVAVLTVTAPATGVPNFDLTGFAALDGFTTFGENQRLVGGVTGGAAGTNVQVWTAIDFAKYAGTNYPVMVEVMTNIDLGIAALSSGITQPTYSNFIAAEVLVRSNKTIYSKNGSTLSHGTLRIGKTSLGPQGNIVIRNLKFRDLYEFDPSGNYDSKGWDYVHLEEASHHVWVDHCDFQQVYDGMLDLSHACDYLTASWNVFRTQKKCSLIGHSDSNQSEDTNHLNVTFHHNYYVNVDERMPRMRFGNAHVYNLYSDNLGGNGIQSTCGSAVLVENSYFYHPKSGSLPTRYENGGPTGTVKVANSTIVNLPGVNVAFRQYGQATFQFNYPFASNQPPYAYVMDATTNVPSLVTNYAGVGKVNPSFLSQPQNQSVTVGQSATFNVTVVGATPLTYRWYFNTNTLVGSGTNGSLNIANAQASNAGAYTVVASNFFGVTTSSVATLTVGSGAVAPSIVTQPQDQIVVTNQNATFTVGAAGTAPLRYQWFFNTNTALGNETNATLVVPNVQNTDAGVYSVRVTNSAGSVTSGFASLVINRAPTPGSFAAATGQETPVSIPENSLVGVASDPDADDLNVTGVLASSTNSGAVSFDGSQVIYSPPAGYTGADLLSYILTDSRSGSSTGRVSITIVPYSSIFAASAGSPLFSAGTSFHASFTGVPNLSYSVDRATNLLGPWDLDFTNLAAGTNGFFEVVDPAPILPDGFYRIRYP